MAPFLQKSESYFPASYVRFIRTRLLAWYADHARDLPWRRSDDPYQIWVSEIMLQQTRVDQAQPYFERFMRAFPTVEDLAKADLDLVLVNWEGLGYYSRARNLHKAAGVVVKQHKGRLPDQHDALLGLPGIGPYTAAAVMSIAFCKPFGVLDGNVIRVLSRLACIEENASLGKTKKALQSLSDELVSPKQPGEFNQAMMELGATICTPQSPKCNQCPVQEKCGAFAEGKVDLFPVLKKKAPVPHYDLGAGVIENEAGELLIQRRPEDGLLGGLWEFPSGNTEPDEHPEAACLRMLKEDLEVEAITLYPILSINHAFTHFKITLHAYKCRIVKGHPTSKGGHPIQWVPLDVLDNFAFPRAHRKLIDHILKSTKNPSLFD